jgi:glycosyltransferase involved in cell wall biosynthesis
VKDLLVTTHTPRLGSGQALRTYGVARALAAGGGGLTLLYARFGASEPDEAFRAIPGIELRAVSASRGLGRLRAYAMARGEGVPGGFARGVSHELAAEAARLAEQPNRGRVIADGPIAAAALAQLARKRPVIYNSHNVESGFRHELGAGSARERRAMRSFERRLLADASECWIVSRAEIGAAHELSPDARLRYVPNVIDVAAITPVAPAPAKRRALFVASFSYPPNRKGLRFLLDEVFPRVWAELPDAQLALAGGGLEEPPSEDRRVQTLGFVEDLAEAYSGASCAVVPLLHGGGSPLKLIEALAYGVPVVATARAAASLELHDREQCLAASDAEEFAAALVRVLRDGAPELARRGREYVASSYSIEALTSLLAAP